MNFHAVVLRDIPKEEARIDLFRIKIQGGFRGFRSDVPLLGWRYASVKYDQFHVGFWCRFSPFQEAVVRVFDSSKGFVEDEPETAQKYTQMALSGAMDQALAPYPIQLSMHWFELVSCIGAANFPPQLHEEDTGDGSRLDKALLGTHGGQADSFLAEFQYAFVRWLVSLDTAAEDEVAFARWRHLLQSAYNAGEDRIRESADLFPQLAGTIMKQFDLLPKGWFKAGSALIEHADYMAEDMIDSGVHEIVERGQAFANYLAKCKQG